MHKTNILMFLSNSSDIFFFFFSHDVAVWTKFSLNTRARQYRDLVKHQGKLAHPMIEKRKKKKKEKKKWRVTPTPYHQYLS